VPSTENKIEVISSVEPAVVNGWLEFDISLPQAVIDQFADIPHGAHDDGADAIVRADRLICGMTAQVARPW
jgi:phage terminase large subunit-like protein